MGFFFIYIRKLQKTFKGASKEPSKNALVPADAAQDITILEFKQMNLKYLNLNSNDPSNFTVRIQHY